MYSACFHVLFGVSVTLHVDSSMIIAGLAGCVSSSQFVDGCLYYRHPNFKLWSVVAYLISSKDLSLTCIKVKSHSGDYFNDHADFLASAAHSHLDLVCLDSSALSSHHFTLAFNDLVVDTNPWHFYNSVCCASYFCDMLHLDHFQFLHLLASDLFSDIDWPLTLRSFHFSPSHDTSFNADALSRFMVFKAQLLFDELPTLKIEKCQHPDLYPPTLTCQSCITHDEDFTHLYLCFNRRYVVKTLLSSYKRYLSDYFCKIFSSLNMDPAPIITHLWTLPCWTFSPSNWAAYALLRGFLLQTFLVPLLEYDITFLSASNNLAKIYNNFISRFQKTIWNSRCY